MFLARQIYLAQIYGIMVAATLTACALIGTFVTCYSDIALHTRSSFAGEEDLTAGPFHLLLTSGVGQRPIMVYSCGLESYKGLEHPSP